MPRYKLKTQQTTLRGGCNYTSDVLSIKNDQAYKILNCHVNDHGVAYTCHGSRVLNNTALDGAVTSIYDYRRPDGTSTASMTLVTAGKKLYKIVDDEFVFVTNLSSSARPTWVTFTDSKNISYAYMANGTDFLKYDGDTISNATTTYPWTYNPKYIMEYDDRMLAAGCDNDDYKIFVSGLQDGTDWLPGEGGTAVYWTAKGSKGDRVMGLGKVYNFAVIFQQFSTSIITEADPDSSTSKQITVSTQYGTTSHWSILSVNNIIYFGDSSHYYYGVLREAIENGLEVFVIDKNIDRQYKNIINHDDMVAVYDATHEEIQIGVRTKGHSRSNITLMYNIANSSRTSYGITNVWSGWQENAGYEPYTLARVIDDENVSRIYRGDSSGFVYVMEEDFIYKHQTVVNGEVVENDIETEIITRAIAPYGISRNKRARFLTPYLFQYYDESTLVYCIIDGRHETPTAGRTIQYRGIVPFWNDGTIDRYAQEWDNTTWNDRPVMPKLINLGLGFNYIQFVITNAGENDRDAIAFNGFELVYQVMGQRIAV
jgi:hypothetical protein